MKEIKYHVEGMSCTGCENRIQNALKEIKEIETVKANYLEKSVTIVLKEDVQEDEIKEIIEDLGFMVD